MPPESRSPSADRQAITDQLLHYCRAMDRIDHALGYAVWHDDGIADYGSLFNGSGRGFVDWVCETHKGLLAHAHRVSNILIELDGDRAGSEAYVNATLRFKEGDQLRQANVHGRYLDRWSCRDGRWAIDRRIYIQDFDDVRNVDTILVGGWGRRDREDPSYAVLPGLSASTISKG
ncbi:MAG: hypothetical protein JWR77_2142 [Rhizorhabdus sp.]|nr:hypothetical protein [Rhizorhabdus sp.]